MKKKVIFSMYNLDIGNEVTGLFVDDEGNETFIMNELSNPTGMQSSSAKAFDWDIEFKYQNKWEW